MKRILKAILGMHDVPKDEYHFLQNTPRYIPHSIRFLGHNFEIPDAPSFLFIKKEIFDKEIYKFQTSSPKPVIIDGGANIGLSVIYFKNLYGNSVIHAFEPDPRIYDYLQKNINAFGCTDVHLHNTGLWNEESTLRFNSEGADGGRVENNSSGDTDNSKVIEIKVVSLRNFLNSEVDMLKLDIEGAELMVLKDCSDLLTNVRNIFVEYHSFAGRPQCLNEILAILSNAGFRYYIQHVGVFSPHPFIKTNTFLSMDLQLNIFGYRR